MRKNQEFSSKNEELCTKNDEFCIKNEFFRALSGRTTGNDGTLYELGEYYTCLHFFRD